jgi:hypothetical protein
MRNVTLALAAAGLLSLATLLPATTPPAAAAPVTYRCHKPGGPPITALNYGQAQQLEKDGYTCRPE